MLPRRELDDRIKRIEESFLRVKKGLEVKHEEDMEMRVRVFLLEEEFKREWKKAEEEKQEKPERLDRKLKQLEKKFEAMKVVMEL